MDAIEQEAYLRDLASAIAKLLEDDFGHEIGFAFFMFEFDKPGITNYISNATRETMIQAIEETLERFKNGEVMPAIIGGKQ